MNCFSLLSALASPHLVPLPLALGFITPAFAAAGAAAISIPIIIHLLNRRRFKTVTWAAMEFLLRAMKKNRKRLKFEQWLLLATRCLLVCLFGLALARLEGCDNRAVARLSHNTVLNVFVIDNSYSKAYLRNGGETKTHLEQAKKVAKEWINAAEKGTLSVVLTTARPGADVVAEPESDQQIVTGAIDRIEQSWSSADLRNALENALKVGERNNKQLFRRLIILTDGSRSEWEGPDSARIKQLGPELSAVFAQIIPIDLTLSQPPQWNGAVLDIKPAANLVSTKFKADFRGDVRSYFPHGQPGHHVTYEWKIDGHPATTGVQELTLDGAAKPPPQTLSDVTFDAGGPHVISLNVNDESDRLQVDNIRHRVVDVASELKVLIVEGSRTPGPLGGSGDYVATALKGIRSAPPGKPAVVDSHFSPEVITPGHLRQEALNDYVAVVLAGVGPIAPEESDELAAFVRQGGALLVFMGDPVDKHNYNSLLFERHGLMPGPLIDVIHGKDFNFDFKPNSVLHPLLATFANLTNTGLDHVPIFKYWQVDPDYLFNLVKGYRDDQLRIDATFDAISQGGDAKAVGSPEEAAADEFKMAGELKDFLERFHDLGTADGSGENVRPTLLAAIAKLQQLGAAGIVRDSASVRREIEHALDSIFKSIEANKPERVLSYLASRSNGPIDPAITAQTVGHGRVVFISTSANQDWTEFPNRMAYLQLVYELLDGSLRSRDWWMNLSVGDHLAVPSAIRGPSVPTLVRDDAGDTPIPVFPPEIDASGEVATSDTEAGKSSQDEWRSQYHTDALNHPGTYTLTLGTRKLPIVVNVPAADEADVVTLDPTAISQALGGIKLEKPTGDTPIHENENDFGWLTMVIALVLVGFESFIALRFGHYRRSDSSSGGTSPGGAAPLVTRPAIAKGME